MKTIAQHNEDYMQHNILPYIKRSPMKWLRYKLDCLLGRSWINGDMA
jgi:hypothetical protein